MCLQRFSMAEDDDIGLPMRAVRPEWYRFRNALYAGDFAAAEALLRDEPALLTERNGLGETVLHFLAIEDSLPGIEWLHAQGGSLNTANDFGTPLLFEVAQLGYRDLLLWLGKHGADAGVKDGSGRTLQEYLVEFDQPEMALFVLENLQNSHDG